MLLIAVNSLVIALAVIDALKRMWKLRRLKKRRSKFIGERDAAFEKARKYMEINSLAFSVSGEQ